MNARALQAAERSTLAALFAGVAALALSPFVSPASWFVAALAVGARALVGPRLGVGEYAASMLGWLAFAVGLVRLATGTGWVVVFAEFLLWLAAAVALEEACLRNWLHRLIAGGFLVFASTVLTDSVLLAVPLVLWIAAMTRAMIVLDQIASLGEALPTPRLARRAAALAVAAVLVFVALPRFGARGPLQPVQPMRHVSGFSDRVGLDAFGVSPDDTIVMRVEPLDPAARRWLQRKLPGLYWRGAVLSAFRGGEWRRAPARWAHAPASAGLASLALYREAVDHPYLVLPEGWTPSGKMRVLVSDAGERRLVSQPTRRMRVLLAQSKEKLPLRPPIPLETDTHGIPESVRRWAEGFAGTPREKLAAAMRELRSWRYALSVPGKGALLDAFIRTRTGYCELFATTLALSLRLWGVPARVVHGYLGGEWNEAGGYALVRARHAHAWVEAWLDGRWVRLDPTPPARRSALARPWPKWMQLWDAVRLAWYRYVLEFESADRARLWRALQEMLAWIAGLAALIATGWGIWRARRVDWEWALVDWWLKRHGIVRKPHEPLRFLAPAGVRPEAWDAFVRWWEKRRYNEGRAGLGALARALRALEK